MSKDIHKWSDGRYTLMFDEHTFFVWDNEKEERMTALNVTKKLNEQQATIKQLESDKAIAEDYANIFEKENVKLRKQIDEQQATRICVWFEDLLNEAYEDDSDENE